MRRKKRFSSFFRQRECVAVGLFFFAYCISCCAAERLPQRDRLFGSASNLIAAVRIDNLAATDQQFEAFFHEINPYSQARAPLQEWIGTVLRNPGLEGLRPDAYLELLLFNPKQTTGDALAFAFPILDPAQYRTVLTSQASIREEGVTDDISFLREDILDESHSLYLTTTAFGLAIFGTSRDAVRQARSLYEKSGIRGLYANGRDEMRAAIHISGIMGIYQNGIEQGLRQLREDVMQDLSGAARKDHPLSLFLGSIFTNVRTLAGQVRRVDVGLSFQPKNLLFRMQCAPEPESALAVCLEDVPDASQNSLYALLPADCVACRETILWPSLWGAIWDGFGEALSASAEALMDQDTKTRIASLRKTITVADPVATATGVMSTRPDSPAHGAVHVLLIRWKKPKEASQLLKRLDGLMRLESLQEAADQVFDGFEWSHDARVAQIGTVPVDRLRFLLHPKENMERTIDIRQRKKIPPLGAAREYFLVQSEDLFILTTSRDLAAARTTLVYRAARTSCLSAIREVLGTMKSKTKPSLPPLASALQISQTKYPAFFASATDPLSMARTILLAAEGWGLPFARPGQPPASRRFAEAFGDAGGIGRANPFVCTVHGWDTDVVMRLTLPRTSLKTFVRICLGITNTGEQK